MITSRTPYRISFFGGGTDYPEWYLKHGGAVFSSTIDKYCYISAKYSIKLIFWDLTSKNFKNKIKVIIKNFIFIKYNFLKNI